MPRFIIPLAGVLIVVLIAVFGFTTRGYSVHVVLVGAPLLLMLSGNVGLIFALVIGLRYSDLIVPGLPQDMNLMDLGMLFLIGLLIVRHSISKQHVNKWYLHDYMLIGFLLVMLWTIVIRGIGIRFLGSSEWGGFTYVKIAISAFFCLFCGRVRITVRQLKFGMILMALLSTVPAIAQLLFYASGGALTAQYMFVEAYFSGLVGTLDALQSDRGTVRLYFTGMASAAALAAMIFFPLHRKTRWLFLLFTGTALGVILLSGFRGATVGLLVTTFLFLFLYYPRQRFPLVVFSIMAAGLLLLGLTPFIQDVPAGIQRALSWVPWYEIPASIEYDASHSLNWRLQVWRETMAYLPAYLWVGRGLTFDPVLMNAALSLGDSISWAYISHNYHNGTLSLLVTMGIPGAFFFAMFCITVMIHIYRGFFALRQSGAEPVVTRIYVAYTALATYGVLAFFLVYGDMKSTVPDLFFMVAMLKVLRINFIHNPDVSKQQAGTAIGPNRLQLNQPGKVMKGSLSPVTG